MYRIFISIFGLLAVFDSAITDAIQNTKDNSTQNLVFLQQHFAIGLVSFALKLTQKLYNETDGKNVLFSPASMYSCLSTAHLASSGATRQELAELIGFPKDDETSAQMHEIAGELIRSVQRSNKSTISLANGLFIQKLLPLREQFNREMEKYYGNEVSTVDFTSGSTATNYINEWIKEQTKGYITKIFEKKLSDTTRIALVNALFFSAKWNHPFSNESTTVEKFDTGSGEVDVPMMQSQRRLYYLNYPPAKFQAIALPYEDYEFIMYIALPYANQTLKNMLNFLNVPNLITALQQTQKAFVDYKIPRMKFHRFASMKEELKKLGLNNFFEKGEFDHLVNSTIDLDVSDVMHAVEMETNEDGTMATAASTTTFNAYSVEMPISKDEPIQFYLDRPFMFFISHKRTNIVMFSAMVHNPLE